MAGLLQTVKPVAASNNALQATTPVKTKVGNKKVKPFEGLDIPRTENGRPKVSTGPVLPDTDRLYRTMPVPTGGEQKPASGMPVAPSTPSGPSSTVEKYHLQKYGKPVTAPGKQVLEPTDDTSVYDALTEEDKAGMSPAELYHLKRYGVPIDYNKNNSAPPSRPPARPPVRPPINEDPADMRGVVGDGLGPVSPPVETPPPMITDPSDMYDDDGGGGEGPPPSETVTPSAERPEVTVAAPTENSSVAQQLQGLLSQNNPYIKQARQQAAEAAAARGLRNSSMAVQAGQEAAIRQALPIAQQDAKQAHQSERDAALQGYELDRTGYAAELQNERDSNIFDMDKEKMSLQQQYTERRDELLHELQQDSMTLQHAQSLETMQKEFENRMTGLSAELDHQNRLNYTNAANQAQIAAMEQIGMMYQNPNMSPEQQRNAVSGIYQRLSQTYRSLEAIYGNLPGVDIPENGTDGGNLDDDWGLSDPRNPPGGGGSSGGGGRNERQIRARV